MAKPANSVATVKLPDDSSARYIVPYYLAYSKTNNYVATLPDLTSDTEILIKDLQQTIPGLKIFSNQLIYGKTALNVAHFNTSSTPKETVIKTKIKYLSSSHMPVVHIYGYAYGLQSPIELKIGFYIYGGNLGWAGAVSMGAWMPEVYLYKYTESSVDYVAIGLKGECYYLGFDVDVQVPCMGSLGPSGTILTSGWTVTSTTTAGGLIPAIGTDNCTQVSYKATLKNFTITANSTSYAYNGTAAKTINLDDIYLGKTAKAADSDKLDGNDSSYFLDTSATAQTKTGNLTLSGTTDVSGGTLKLRTINAPTSSGGISYGAGSSGQILKSNGTTVYWASDSNTDTWRNIQVDGTEKLGTGTNTGALNFVSADTNNGDITFTYSSGIKATAKIPTSLKNPSAIKIQGGGADVSTYDGSSAKTFNWAASTTKGAFTISDGTTTKTVQLAGSFTDTNYYPSRSYSSGLQISTSQGTTNTCALYVPDATTTQAGVITTSAQTFGGNKTFSGNVIIQNPNTASEIYFYNGSTGSNVDPYIILNDSSGGDFQAWLRVSGLELADYVGDHYAQYNTMGIWYDDGSGEHHVTFPYGADGVLGLQVEIVDLTGL